MSTENTPPTTSWWERQAARERMEGEQRRLEWERQEARELWEARLRVSAAFTFVAAVFGILLLTTPVCFMLAVCLHSAFGATWPLWCATASLGGLVLLGIVGEFTDQGPFRFPPSPEALELAMSLPPDAASVLERVLDSREQEFTLVSSAQREQRRRALLVRAVHVLGDSAAPIVDDAIKQGLDPLTGLLEAAVNAPR